MAEEFGNLKLDSVDDDDGGIQYERVQLFLALFIPILILSPKIIPLISNRVQNCSHWTYSRSFVSCAAEYS